MGQFFGHKKLYYVSVTVLFKFIIYLTLQRIIYTLIIFSYILLLTFFRRSAYLTFLDHVLQEMKSRFSGVYRNATMGGQSIGTVFQGPGFESRWRCMFFTLVVWVYILPNNVNNLTAEMTDTIMSFHSRDLPAAATWQNLWRTADEKPTSIEDTLNHPRVSSVTFPNIVSILNLMLLLPVTSAGVERANSALKCIKQTGGTECKRAD